jgi:hypothetical protein
MALLDPLHVEAHRRDRAASFQQKLAKDCNRARQDAAGGCERSAHRMPWQRKPTAKWPGRKTRRIHELDGKLSTLFRDDEGRGQQAFTRSGSE